MKGTLSGKFYLFIAFAAVIISLAIGQGILFMLLGNSISEEVSKKSQILSKEIISFATGNIDLSNIRATIQQSNADIVLVDKGNGKVKLTLPSSSVNGVNMITQSNVDAPSVETPEVVIPSEFIEANRHKMSRSYKQTLDRQLEAAGNEVERARIEAELKQIIALEQHVLSEKLAAAAKELKRVQWKLNKKQEMLQNPEMSPESSDIIQQAQQKEIQLAIKKSLEKVELKLAENAEKQRKAKEKANQVWVLSTQNGNNNVTRKHIEIQDPAKAVLEQVATWSWGIVGLSTLIGLVMAYMISAQFNKPLLALSAGYQKVSDGDFTVQVEPTGFKESKAAMEGFNQMTSRLANYRQQEESIREKKHLLELGEVARGIAHALRNPIHTLGLSLDKLAGMTQSSEASTLEAGMRNKLGHMDKTIQSLMMLTANGICRDNTVMLDQVVQDVVFELRMTDSKQLQFGLELSEHLVIKGAETEIRTMLHTLIVNAVEASPINGVIEIKGEKDADMVMVSVCDQGSGIDESIAGRVFEPHTTTKAEGTGMGLYITQRMAQLYYKGSVTLENCENGGCSAHLILATEGDV